MEAHKINLLAQLTREERKISNMVAFLDSPRSVILTHSERELIENQISHIRAIRDIIAKRLEIHGIKI